jgi:hypothetical protein
MKWELVSSLGHTTLTVGSNSDCTWVVRADGVRPIHFSLHWDGNTLRAADVYSAGDVRVDGSPLTSQWKPLLGRTRVEFGRAALVVEASASSLPRLGDHPLESAPAKNDGRRPAQRSGKETLIGVAPNMLAGLMTPGGRPSDSSSPPPAHSSPAGPPSSRPPVGTPVTRPSADRSATDRSMKATLVGGIGISPVPTPLAQQAAINPKANATLVGISPTDALRGVLGVGQPAPGASLGSADQRTAQGFPREGQSSSPPAGASSVPSGRRMTQKGMVSQQPGVSPDAVSRAPVRSVASDPPETAQQRINSAWQERPDESEMAGRTLRGMSMPGDDSDRVPGAPRMPRVNDSRWGDLGDRLSDIPTQMRDPASFESRRPSRGFPWRYVGVLVLTAVAYFAWLYLLDHM